MPGTVPTTSTRQTRPSRSTAAPDTLNRRIYPLQNWRADVVAVYDLNEGVIAERVKYSAYGVPFGISAADFDADGDVDAADNTAYSNANTAGDASADLNLDGVVDFNDTLAWNNLFNAGETGGRSVLSRGSVRNRIGYAGYQHDPSITGSGQASGQGRYHVRFRVYDAGVGRWTRRDPLGYVDGLSLMAYGKAAPITNTDVDGLTPYPPVALSGVGSGTRHHADPPDPAPGEGVELPVECDDTRLDVAFINGTIRTWLSYLCADAVNDDCVAKIACIVSAMSCVESRHGAGTGASAARDPMQVGDLNNPAWTTIVSGSWENRPRRRGDCQGISWQDISTSSDMHAAIDENLPGRDRERFCPVAPRRLPTQGNLSSRWTTDMSYFWGIGWFVYGNQIASGRAWDICSRNMNNEEWIHLAVIYNGGGDPRYGAKIRSYLRANADPVCQGLVR